MLRVFHIAVIQRTVIDRTGSLRILIRHIEIRGNALQKIVILPADFGLLIHLYRTKSRYFFHIIRRNELLHQNISGSII